MLTSWSMVSTPPMGPFDEKTGGRKSCWTGTVKGIEGARNNNWKLVRFNKKIFLIRDIFLVVLTPISASLLSLYLTR